MLSLVTFFVSVAAALGAAYSIKVVRELSAVTKERDELEKTVLCLVDGEDTLQLALPGQVEALGSAQDRLAELQKELDKSESEREKISSTLLEVLDKDKQVLHKIRIPGEVRNPDRTPCGRSCNHAYWMDYVGNRDNGLTEGNWLCHMNQGIECNNSRKLFLDSEDQCVHYEARA